MSVSFTVYGVAKPAGSKRAFVNPKTGRAIVTDANKNSKPWKAEVTAAAAAAMDGARLLDGALTLHLTFWVPRPKGHISKATGAPLPSAPAWPAVKPDLLKLARGIEDALTGVVYRDDAQIVCEVLKKAYTTSQARTEVCVVPREGAQPVRRVA